MLAPPFIHVPFLFFLFSAAAAAKIYDTNNTGCRIYECGNVNISYPFWYNNPSNTPLTYCGYKDFGITCLDNNTPIFTTATDNYTVHSIDSDKKIISVVDSDVAGKQCPKAKHNVTLTNFPALNLTPGVVGVLFFFNCSSGLRNDPRIPKQNEATCLQNQAELSYVFSGDSLPPPDVYATLIAECKGVPVESQVRRSDLKGNNLSDAFGEVMNKGFDLKWDVNTAGSDNSMADCRKCEANRGLCGYNHGKGGLQFQCFCPIGSPGCFPQPKAGPNVLRKVLVAIAGAGFGVIVAAVAVFFWHKRKKRLEKRSSSVTTSFFKSITPSNTSSIGFGSTDAESPAAGCYKTPTFTYQELEAATGGFSHELGDGGFGTVYKGKLKDGRVVAIKCLHQNTDRRVQQFRNEIEILNRLRHQNLVTLYGCSAADSPKLLLVYEYVPNGTVADHLHGHRSPERALLWPLRMIVAIETAAALSYLHAVKPQIIHRDVKTTNILLDSDFHVKVADFGLSRLFPDRLGITHVSTAPQGTPGYVDPEYHQCYQLTDKSDVYSFGVVLVELVSSMPAVDVTRRRSDINLSNMALEKISAGLVGELADARLGYGTHPEVTGMMEAVCELAFRCLQQERDMRPTMHEVLEELRRIHTGGDWGCGGGNSDKEKNRSSSEDVCLLNIDVHTAASSPPFTPNTVNGTSWPTRSSTPNASI